MKVPINQKFMLTIIEASEYFGIGEKVLRIFAADHQEISIRYGNRWRIIRAKTEFYSRREQNRPGSLSDQGIMCEVVLSEGLRACFCLRKPTGWTYWTFIGQTKICYDFTWK